MIKTKVISALISSAIISLLLMWIAISLTNTIKMGYISTFLVLFIILSILYLIVAVPCSIGIDSVLKKMKPIGRNVQIVRFFIYVISGLLAVMLMLGLLVGDLKIVFSLRTTLIGGLMGLVYYVAVRLVESVQVKRNK